MNGSRQTVRDSPPSRPSASRSTLEKRGAGRVPARFMVELCHEGELDTAHQAELLNLGRAGFRARHSDARIQTGTLVAFRHRFGEGMARVMWTKPSSGESFESGFKIVERAP